MEKIYHSKVGWWVYALIPFVVFCCMVGPILTKSDYWLGFVLSVPFCLLIIYLIATTKYAIHGDEIGVRCGFRWSWFPISKIESVSKVNGILASPALSIHRIAIKFSDRKILKSSSPLEISPKDGDGFISDLLKINPNIKYS